MSAGQPFFESLPSQVTVTEYDCPGWMVCTCCEPPGLQSSDDHTRAVPEVMTSSFCAAPMSRRQGLLEVFWIRIRRRGVEPTGYDAASVEAVTAMSSSAHRGTPVVVGLALGDFDVEVDADAEGDGEVGFADGEAGDEEGLVDGVAPDDEDDPNVRCQTQRAPSTSATTTSSASSRRTQ